MKLPKILKKLLNLSKATQHNHYLQHKEQARALVHQLLQQFGTKFSYNRVSIKNQKTRWGSCSSKGNLNFNYRILFLPQELAEYIVVHELCHLRQMNHSKKFWQEVETILPDYKNLKQNLTNYQLNNRSI